MSWKTPLILRQYLQDKCNLWGCCEFYDDFWQVFDHYYGQKYYIFHYKEGYEVVQYQM